MTLGALLKTHGINITASMTMLELAAVWSVAPESVKSKYPAITSALVSLAAAAAALETAQTLYATYVKATKTAEKAFNTANRAATPVVGPALVTAEATSEAQGGVVAGQDTALQASTDSLKTTILDTVVV